jgi:hypothetical protein
MTKHNTGQTCFTVIEFILVLVIIGSIVSVGWYVQRSLQHISNTYNTATTTSSTNSPKFSSKKTAKTRLQYLNINEWGVKIPLSSTISDAYYVAGVSSVGADGVTNQAYLGLASLDSDGCTASGSNRGLDSALAMIFRSKSADVDPVTGKAITVEYPNGVTIGGYYYALEGLTGSDISTCKAPRAMIQSVENAFSAALKGLIAESQYLDIKEWGLTAQYSGSFKLTYMMSSDHRMARFSSDQLTTLDGNCVGRGGTILRYAPTDKVSEGPADASTPTAATAFANVDPSLWAHVGNYYYLFVHDMAACDNPSVTATAQAQTNDAVKALVPKLQTATN